LQLRVDIISYKIRNKKAKVDYSTLDVFLNSLIRLQGSISSKEIEGIVKTPEKHITIPVKIFGSDTAPFETLCVYLKKKFSFPIKKIAAVTKRSPKTIWTTINNAKEKIVFYDDGIRVPLEIFCQREKSILESLCSHLSENEGMGITEIGMLIRKSPKTVWTVINRAREKNEINK
jgi:hypothetical protein